MRILTLIGGLAFWPQMALAGDMALVLGDIGQIATLRNETATISADFAGPLREAGFEVVQPKNRSSGNMRLAAQRIEAALGAGEVDRLVIVVMGPIASSARESWALSNGAAGATSLNVGVTGVSLGALSDMASAARGRAVILIAPGRSVTTLGNGLMPGVKDLHLAPDVTYVIGPAASLAGVLSDGLLVAGKSFSEVAGDAPEDVQILGFTSAQVGLMTD
ncbi:hypothetical protein [uncultured Roseovarius sp.]|uniref:hypothetical protein n=1 Tax=uncultured Roseovarius sp. TaxID=293344 RepID=UPI0026172DE7|nr:hypothetical protein [uncultured Roseovarius sp.]